MYKYLLVWLLAFSPLLSYAGNPDRQGEAGAFELLLSPWGQSSALNLLNTSCVSGVEAMRLNPAGLHFEGKTQIALANMQMYRGSGMQMNSAGFAQKVGTAGTMSFVISSLDFGNIDVTSVGQPGGTGGTFKPNYIQMGVGYSHNYDDKIYVGVLFRGISEQIIDVSAFGAAVDAGVQYVGGDNKQFRLGVSLLNIGPSMIYKGEGFTAREDGSNNGSVSFLNTYYYRTQKFELPTTLNLGIAYDFSFAAGRDYLRTMANFTSNAFSRDDIGAGAEYSFKELLVLRASYKYNLGEVALGQEDIYTGLGAGFSVNLRPKKDDKGVRKSGMVSIDYAYRTTQHYQGTHNIGLRLTM